MSTNYKEFFFFQNIADIVRLVACQHLTKEYSSHMSWDAWERLLGFPEETECETMTTEIWKRHIMHWIHQKATNKVIWTFYRNETWSTANNSLKLKGSTSRARGEPRKQWIDSIRRLNKCGYNTTMTTDLVLKFKHRLTHCV